MPLLMYCRIWTYIHSFIVGEHAFEFAVCVTSTLRIVDFGLRGEIRTHDLRSFCYRKAFCLCILRFPLSSAYIFSICCSVLLKRLYLFTLYALQCLKAFRNPLTYLGISILQPSPILPNFTWAIDPKPVCYQTAPLGVIDIIQSMVRIAELRLNLSSIQHVSSMLSHNKLELPEPLAGPYSVLQGRRLTSQPR